MTVYTHFLGIDIGKFNFVVAHHGHKRPHTFTNDEEGITLFLQEYEEVLAGGS